MQYFITFACYGAHLHGEAGSVDREHNVPGTPLVEVDTKRVRNELARMEYGAYLLDGERREVVLAALREVCKYRDWKLCAAHVRTNHVHVVVEAEMQPEICMNAFKAYASRDINNAGLDVADRDRKSTRLNSSH